MLGRKMPDTVTIGLVLAGCVGVVLIIGLAKRRHIIRHRASMGGMYQPGQVEKAALPPRHPKEKTQEGLKPPGAPPAQR